MGTIVTSNTDTFHAGRYMYLQDRAFSTIPNNSVNSDPKSDTDSPDWQRQHKILAPGIMYFSHLLQDNVIC